MKVIVSILTSLSLSLNLFGQHLETKQLYMSDTANQQWLTKLKAQKTTLQWEMIVDRYFQNVDASTEGVNSKRIVPLLIIDGIAIDLTAKTNIETKTKLRSLLTNDKIVSILVMDKEPDGLYINKAFTGIVLVKTNDRKISKKLPKIKFL